MEYLEFLESKKKNIENSGFDVSELNPALFDFQHSIVKTALKKGRYAIFADCGLGKTLMQLEWANQVVKHTHKPVLIFGSAGCFRSNYSRGNEIPYPRRKMV